MFKPTIYLDMDGVLANFNSAVFNILNRTLDSYPTSQEGWDALGTRRLVIYSHLEVLSDAQQLVSQCSTLAELYGYNLGVLTALPKIGRVPLANQHKREWIAKHFPELLAHYYIGPWAEDKHKHCKIVDGVSDILIDDQGRNINQWLVAGGYGIVHCNTQDSIAKLKAYLTTTHPGRKPHE